MNSQKGAANILLIVLIIAVAAVFVFAVSLAIIQKSDLPETLFPNEPKACTQEAKLCPDGSAVGRTGPNCEFADCPKENPTVCTQDVIQCTDGSYVSRIAPNCNFAPCPQISPNETQVSLREGQRESSLLVQRIYPDYIIGLNFWEYPIATNQGHPVTLYVGQSASNGCTITLTLVSIQNNTAIFTKKTDFNKICPICLSEDTLIDTPNGQIPVQHLQAGMAIWTVDEKSNRITGTIIKTSKTPVPANHPMIHIILKDQREIFASPGHPIGNGRIFNDLSIGDMLDGSYVIVSEKRFYDKGYTYDILPSGNTGFYFANGIMIDSTLH